MSTSHQTDGVCIGEIQREYLLDLKSRTSPAHYKNVKQRLERTVAALGAAEEHDLQPLAVIRHRNQVRERGASN